MKQNTRKQSYEQPSLEIIKNVCEDVLNGSNPGGNPGEWDMTAL